MTKNDKITEAYGDFVGIDSSAIQDVLNNNGWILKRFIPPSFDMELFDIVDIHARPKLLKGIEDNNGWTCIKQKSDIPNFYNQDNTKYRVCFNNKISDEIYIASEIYDAFVSPGSKPTHYKLYIPDGNPLY